MFIFNRDNALKYKTYYLDVYDNHCPKFPAFQFLSSQACLTQVLQAVCSPEWL